MLVEELQGHFGCVLFGIVDELTIIPVAGGDVLALDSDGARPSGTTSYNSDARAISIPLSSSELKVGVHSGSFCSSTPAMPRHAARCRQGKARELEEIHREQKRGILRRGEKTVESEEGV